MLIILIYTQLKLKFDACLCINLAKELKKRFIVLIMAGPEGIWWLSYYYHNFYQIYCFLNGTPVSFDNSLQQLIIQSIVRYSYLIFKGDRKK